MIDAPPLLHPHEDERGIVGSGISRSHKGYEGGLSLILGGRKGVYDPSYLYLFHQLGD